MTSFPPFDKDRVKGQKKRKKESGIVQLCLTLCDPMDCSPPDSSIHGIFQARVLEWVVISSSRGSSWLTSAGRFFTNWATRETRIRVQRYSKRLWNICNYIKISGRIGRGHNKTLMGISWHDQKSNICCQGRNYMPFPPIFSELSSSLHLLY